MGTSKGQLFQFLWSIKLLDTNSIKAPEPDVAFSPKQCQHLLTLLQAQLAGPLEQRCTCKIKLILPNLSVSLSFTKSKQFLTLTLGSLNQELPRIHPLWCSSHTAICFTPIGLWGMAATLRNPPLTT
jgi:hypothetical protein